MLRDKIQTRIVRCHVLRLVTQIGLPQRSCGYEPPPEHTEVLGCWATVLMELSLIRLSSSQHVRSFSCRTRICSPNTLRWWKRICVDGHRTLFNRLGSWWKYHFSGSETMERYLGHGVDAHGPSRLTDHRRCWSRSGGAGFGRHDWNLRSTDRRWWSGFYLRSRCSLRRH